MQQNDRLRKRLSRLRDNNGDGSDTFCVCGNYTRKCRYHKPGADPVLARAADLMALLGEHHEIDYDTCSTNEKAVVEDIAAYLRGEDGPDWDECGEQGLAGICDLNEGHSGEHAFRKPYR